jgi:hypothetical protein
MESRWSKGSPSKLNTNIIDIYIFQNVVLIIVLKIRALYINLFYILTYGSPTEGVKDKEEAEEDEEEEKEEEKFICCIYFLNPIRK